MKTLQESLPLFMVEGTTYAGMTAFLKWLKAHIDNITAGSITPAAQAEVDALFASVFDAVVLINEAIIANTPGAVYTNADHAAALKATPLVAEKPISVKDEKEVTLKEGKVLTHFEEKKPVLGAHKTEVKK